MISLTKNGIAELLNKDLSHGFAVNTEKVSQ